MLFCLWGCENFFSGPPLVGVIQWTKEVQAFEDSRQGVVDGLREQGYQDGLNLRLKVVNVNGDRSRAAEAAKDFLGQKAQLLITLGTIPTLIALEVTRDSWLPIVYSIVAAPAATGLAWPEKPARPRFTGTSMEVAAAEQLSLLLQAKPQLKRLGILYCTATPQAIATGEAAASAAPALGLRPIWETIPDDRPELLQEALAKLRHQDIEALFLPADPVLARANNLKAILTAAQKARVPVMVPSGDLVSLGALMAYHGDFVEIGRQSGRQAARLLAGASPGSVPPEAPKVKRLTLNLKAAREIDLPLSRQLLSRAHKLY
ncbi:MAG: ABC transporter substrate-binding protein [Thermodesulfobacteriota bacterium]